MENGYTLPALGRQRQVRHRSIVGPIILIGIGALFLAQNLGLAGADIWLTIWRLWPLFLVLVGVDLFLRGRSWTNWLTIALLVVAVMVMAAIGATTALVQPNWVGWMTAGPMTVEEIAEETSGASRATLDLRHSAGMLTVGALAEDSAQLIAAELAHPDNVRVDRQIERRGDRVDVRLVDARNVSPFVAGSGRREWDVRLSRHVPVEIRVDAGASDIDLNLRDLLVTGLDIDAGAAKIKVELPARARQTNVTVRTGVARVEVTVPEGVAARIHPTGALNRLSIDGQRFEKMGEYYESPDYYIALNRVDIELAAGISEVTVR